MTDGGAALPLSGVIEADEIDVGGKARNRQKHRDPSTRGRGTDKPMVFAGIERGGAARSARVASASGATLDPLAFQ